MNKTSKVRIEDASDLSNQAKMMGLEHRITTENNNWCNFQFTTKFSKLAFDEMARRTGYTVAGYNSSSRIIDVLDAVCEGAELGRVLDFLVEADINITKGMRNAYSRFENTKYICSNEQCNVSIPKYRGNYPKVCPACGSRLLTPEERLKRESESF